MKDIQLTELKQAFEEKVLPRTTKVGSCLLFEGGLTGSGYGSSYIGTTIVSAHRLAYAYYNNTTNLGDFHVLHSCDVRNCIAKEHLRLGTHKENMQDMVDRSRSSRKFTDKEIKEIFLATEDTSFLVAKYNVSKQTINTIRSGKEWGEVTKGLISELPEGRERTRLASAILTKEQVEEVYLAKDTLSNLAAKFNTDITTISKIKSGINWKDVTKSLGEAGSSEHPFKAKLTKEAVAIIYTSLETSKELASRFNITTRSVNQIRSKETWRSFTKTLDQLGDKHEMA